MGEVFQQHKIIFIENSPMFPLLVLLTHKHPPQPSVLSQRIKETSLFVVKGGEHVQGSCGVGEDGVNGRMMEPVWV